MVPEEGGGVSPGVTRFNIGSPLPDDIRAAGWIVGVHNDYILAGERFTLWLFTNGDNQFVRGEGRTDTDALDNVRSEINRLEHNSPDPMSFT